MTCIDPNCKAHPLIVEVIKAVYRESVYEKENIVKLAGKIDWGALHQTVVDLGEVDFPKNPTAFLTDDIFLRKLHRILLDVLSFFTVDSYRARKADMPKM